MNNVIILERIFSMLIAFFCTSSECNFKDTILRKNLIIFFFPFFFPDADYSTIEYLHGGAYLHRYIIKEYLFTKYVSDRVNILRRDFDKTASGDRTKAGTRKKKIFREKALRPAIAHLRNAESIKAKRLQHYRRVHYKIIYDQ